MRFPFFYHSLVPNTEAVDEATEDSWTTMEPMPTARAGFGVAVVNGKIYAIGGFNGSSYLSTNEMYDPETDTWTTGTPMPTPRRTLRVAVVNDLLYAIGGRDADNYRNENEQYTPIDYIPEFPSWTPILITFVVLAMTLAIYKRRLLKIPIY